MVVRVLLVDDAADARAEVVRALGAHGGFALVGQAADVAEAVACARRTRPDVVLLDVGLPDLVGREVLTHIRKATPHSRVVVYSGHEGDDWFGQHAEGLAPPGTTAEYLVTLLDKVGRHGRQTVREHFAGDPASVPRARRFVTRELGQWHIDAVRDEAALVVTELAANAVDHAHSDFEVRLALTDRALRVEVLDNGHGTPDPRPPTAGSERGRGLLLVSAMSAAWGVDDVVDDGKVVWAELALEPA